MSVNVPWEELDVELLIKFYDQMRREPEKRCLLTTFVDPDLQPQWEAQCAVDYPAYCNWLSRLGLRSA